MGDNIISYNPDPAEKDQSEAYWSPERRAAAIPEPALIRKGNLRPRQWPDGEPAIISEPSTPDPGFEPGGPILDTTEAHRVPYPDKYPYTTVGKLFYTRGGQDWQAIAFITKVGRLGFIFLPITHFLQRPTGGQILTE